MRHGRRDDTRDEYLPSLVLVPPGHAMPDF